MTSKNWVLMVKDSTEDPEKVMKTLFESLKEIHRKHSISRMNDPVTFDNTKVVLKIPIKFRKSNLMLFHFYTSIGQHGISAVSLSAKLEAKLKEKKKEFKFELLPVTDFNPQTPADRIAELETQIEFAKETANQLWIEEQCPITQNALDLTSEQNVAFNFECKHSVSEEAVEGLLVYENALCPKCRTTVELMRVNVWSTCMSRMLGLFKAVEEEALPELKQMKESDYNQRTQMVRKYLDSQGRPFDMEKKALDKLKEFKKHKLQDEIKKRKQREKQERLQRYEREREELRIQQELEDLQYDFDDEDRDPNYVPHNDDDDA